VHLPRHRLVVEVEGQDAALLQVNSDDARLLQELPPGGHL
jgi:hypothetical protein